MKMKILLEQLTSVLLILLVVVMGWWFLVFAIKESLNYSVFTSITNEFFMISIFAILSLLLGIATINISLNLGIIAHHVASKENGITKQSLTKPVLIFLGLVVCLSVLTFLSLHMLNRHYTAMKIQEIKLEMTQVVESFAPQLQTIAKDILHNTTSHAIRENLKIIASNSPYFRGVDIIFPVKKGEKVMFLRIPPFESKDPTISNISSRVHLPNTFQLEYLTTTLEEKNSTSGVFVKRPYYNIYQPILSDGHVVYFLYSDYHHLERKSYK